MFNVGMWDQLRYWLILLCTGGNIKTPQYHAYICSNKVSLLKKKKLSLSRRTRRRAPFGLERMTECCWRLGCVCYATGFGMEYIVRISGSLRAELYIRTRMGYSNAAVLCYFCWFSAGHSLESVVYGDVRQI